MKKKLTTLMLSFSFVLLFTMTAVAVPPDLSDFPIIKLDNTEDLVDVTVYSDSGTSAFTQYFDCELVVENSADLVDVMIYSITDNIKSDASTLKGSVSESEIRTAQARFATYQGPTVNAIVTNQYGTSYSITLDYVGVDLQDGLHVYIGFFYW